MLRLDVPTLTDAALTGALRRLPALLSEVHDERARRSAARDATSAANAAVCIVCLSAPRAVVFGCDHFVACARCAAAVDECPVCRAAVVDRRAVYT